METTPAAPPSNAAPQAESQRPLHLTEAAVAQVKKIIQEQGFHGFYFSVRVVPAGCSGLGYDLNLVKEAKPRDTVWEQEGVKIATDALSTQYLSGTVVDFVSSVTEAGFKFNNPNAKQSCGCGTSFTA